MNTGPKKPAGGPGLGIWRLEKAGAVLRWGQSRSTVERFIPANQDSFAYCIYSYKFLGV
jgi:hypothetical protein